MSTSLDPYKDDNRGTYFILDRKSQKELTRLTIGDQMITAGMGGVLAEQPDPSIFRRVLDVGCGTGGWIIEAAKAYPTMSLVGIDISKHMIEYARMQAHQVSNEVEFRVMDALLILEFSNGFFDLVNLRFGATFLRTWDWPKMLSELQRVTRPRGIIRITEPESVQSNSPALTRLTEMLECALFRGGHSFTPGRTGVTDQLAQLLKQHGCQQIQTKAHAIEYQAGTIGGEAFYEDLKLFYQTIRRFLQKWGCADKDYEAIYQQAVDEMHQPNFHATWNFLTAWGYKSK